MLVVIIREARKSIYEELKEGAVGRTREWISSPSARQGRLLCPHFGRMRRHKPGKPGGWVQSVQKQKVIGVWRRVGRGEKCAHVTWISKRGLPWFLWGVKQGKVRNQERFTEMPRTPPALGERWETRLPGEMPSSTPPAQLLESILSPLPTATL